MKIMITGGSGFIGSHLCEEFLKDNHEIIVLTRNASKIDNISHIISKITLEQVDVTDFTNLGNSIEKNKPDVIIHLAGETSHSKSFENPLYDTDVNTKSTLFILEKIKTLNLKCRFILGSTFIVIGRPTNLPVTEETPCNPTTIYGANRLASENYCTIYHNVYGTDALVFRITNSFGPREQHISNKNAINFLIYKAFKGEEITIFDKGDFFRDVIYVSDVVSAIKTIMQKGQAGNIYWISSGRKTWFYELGDWLKELTNSQVKYIESPQYTKKVDVGNFLVDNSKLKSLGWDVKTPVKEGIRKTLEYFTSHNR
ncbi:NAD-dependent epimerase/dehydratase family protein [Candidatus Nitrosotenuis sp. DW1]|uniref:NAD-dependent epimerase/dehydratase family protein n=1 Tax=Candidatus Nitrosotenuis sp. DW1 TaxID=2259672 RepID=UPI0015C8F756|nr:NAD-dependent epimerase/dehydratase family protein [Candidatus Nitrosotenuis sp. DW1]QLH09707.1 epimerase [Candidatus Nitrosotenuis sp. DW1]